jgi:hypothetical protein
MNYEFSTEFVGDSLSVSLWSDFLHFLNKGFKKDGQRENVVSMYLGILTLLSTLLKSFIPELTDADYTTGINGLAHLTAIIYGIDIVTAIFYIIYCQVGWVKRLLSF